jgi:hypothetical protein
MGLRRHGEHADALRCGHRAMGHRPSPRHWPGGLRPKGRPRSKANLLICTGDSRAGGHAPVWAVGVYRVSVGLIRWAQRYFSKQFRSWAGGCIFTRRQLMMPRTARPTLLSLNGDGVADWLDSHGRVGPGGSAGTGCTWWGRGVVSGGPRPLRLLVFDDANPANARGLLRSGSRGRSGVDGGCIRRRPRFHHHDRFELMRFGYM